VTNKYSTDQEAFWAGKFGDEYIKRNAGDPLIGSNTAMFSKLIASCSGVESLIEFGANVGLNLMAIRRLCPGWTLDAIEINAEAWATSITARSWISSPTGNGMWC
jgi:spore coat polysaccharide biosynthesis protein SpsF